MMIIQGSDEWKVLALLQIDQIRNGKMRAPLLSRVNGSSLWPNQETVETT